MLKQGDVLDLSPPKIKFFIKKTSAETDGQASDMEWELGPETGGTPVHTHPEAIETYDVLEGKLDLLFDGAWMGLSAGENVVVEAGKAIPFQIPAATSHVSRTLNSRR